MNSRRLLSLFALLALVLSTVAIAACGEDKSSSGSPGKPSGGPATLAPAGSPVYLEASVKPGDDQTAALEKLVAKVPGDHSLGDIKTAIDKSLKDDPDNHGETYTKDIEPWLGDRVGLFFPTLAFKRGAASQFGSSAKHDTPPFGVVLAAKDTGKAKDEIESSAKRDKDTKRSYKGVDYYVEKNGNSSGLVGDFVVVGAESAFKRAVDVSKGGASLATSSRFKEATDTLPTDRLGFGYVDGVQVVDAMVKSGALPSGAAQAIKQQFGAIGRGTATFAAVARDDGLLFEGDTPPPKNGQRTASPLLGELPATSWLAIASPDVGASLKQALASFSQLAKNAGSGNGASASPDALLGQLKAKTGFDLQRDVISWLGDTAFFAGGTGLLNLTAGAVIQSKDTGASARAIKKLQGLVGKFGGGRVRAASVPGGFALTIPGAPAPFTVVQRGNKVVMAYGRGAVDQALNPAQKLADSAAFKSAQSSLGSGFDVAGYIGFQPILALVEGVGATSSAQYKQAKPYLDILDSLIFGTKAGSDRSQTRVLLKVK